MKIKVIGKKEDVEEFKRVIPEFIDENHADAQVFVIDSEEVLMNLPRTFHKKTFLYIKEKNPEIFSRIGGFKVSGLIYPPLNRDKLLKKLNIDYSGNEGGFEIIKSKILAKAASLPTLPTVIQKLLTLTGNDKSSFKDVIDELKKDQGLVGKILKIVNSPFYGIRKEIDSVDRAAILLGMETIKNIALAAFSVELFNKNLAYYNTDPKSLWLHSFLVARVAEEIGKLSEEVSSESMYLAGLMHDLGKIVLVDFLTRSIESVDDELNLFGITHAETSAFILEKWNVEKTVVEAVKFHHEKGKEYSGDVIYYANLLAKNNGDEELLKEACETLNINLYDFLPRVEMILKENHDVFY